ncbi:TraR/DksA C4-type zinc finger protein [Acidithiobacillus caldus]
MLQGDEGDIASQFEEAERAAAISRLRLGPQEDPDEDDRGNRYCLDCGEIIPPARVQAVQAVRCVDCASLLERGKPRVGVGGISRYLRVENDGQQAGSSALDDDLHVEDIGIAKL